MLEDRNVGRMHALLIGQVRRGQISPAEAERVMALYVARAPSAPLVAIVQAPETWARLMSTLHVEGAMGAFGRFLGAAIAAHRVTGDLWAPVHGALVAPGLGALTPEDGPVGGMLLREDSPRQPLPDGPIWGSGDDLSRAVDAGRFVEVCPCCVRSEPRVQKIKDFKEFGLNKLEFEIRFDLGIASRQVLRGCELEWWECPSRAYLGGGVRLVQADRWTDLSDLYEQTPGASRWCERTTQLKKLCEEGDSKTRIAIVLEDTPGIPYGEGHARERRYLNIEVRVKSGGGGDGTDSCPEQRIARILVIQSNDRDGDPNGGRVIDLGKRGRYLTLDYRDRSGNPDPWGRETVLPAGVAAGPARRLRR